MGWGECACIGLPQVKCTPSFGGTPRTLKSENIKTEQHIILKHKYCTIDRDKKKKKKGPLKNGITTSQGEDSKEGRADGKGPGFS